MTRPAHRPSQLDRMTTRDVTTRRELARKALDDDVSSRSAMVCPFPAFRAIHSVFQQHIRPCDQARHREEKSRHRGYSTDGPDDEGAARR
jgi:hypothetical protein